MMDSLVFPQASTSGRVYLSDQGGVLCRGSCRIRTACRQGALSQHFGLFKRGTLRDLGCKSANGGNIRRGTAVVSASLNQPVVAATFVLDKVVEALDEEEPPETWKLPGEIWQQPEIHRFTEKPKEVGENETANKTVDSLVQDIIPALRKQVEELQMLTAVSLPEVEEPEATVSQTATK